MTTDTAAEVRQLTERECWALLRSVEIGRLAVLDGEQLEIFPINFVVDHGTVIFRTAAGAKLRAVADARAVAFEADSHDPATRRAWSVVVKGTAQPVLAGELPGSVALPLWPWQPDPKPRFVRIVPVEVSGRSFGMAEADRWRTPLSPARADIAE